MVDGTADFEAGRASVVWNSLTKITPTRCVLIVCVIVIIARVIVAGWLAVVVRL